VGILIVGQQQNVADIQLSELHISLSYGKNRPLFGRHFDLQPAAMRTSPDPKLHIPWLYADDVTDVRVRNVRVDREPAEPHRFDMSSVCSGGVVEDHVTIAAC
jgi:hypothetical protein